MNEQGQGFERYKVRNGEKEIEFDGTTVAGVLLCDRWTDRRISAAGIYRTTKGTYVAELLDYGQHGPNDYPSGEAPPKLAKASETSSLQDAIAWFPQDHPLTQTIVEFMQETQGKGLLKSRPVQ